MAGGDGESVAMCSLRQAIAGYMADTAELSTRKILGCELSGEWLRACDAYHGGSASESDRLLPVRVAEKLVAAGLLPAIRRVKARFKALAAELPKLTPEQMAAVDAEPELPVSDNDDDYFEFDDELYHENDELLEIGFDLAD